MIENLGELPLVTKEFIINQYCIYPNIPLQDLIKCEHYERCANFYKCMWENVSE